LVLKFHIALHVSHVALSMVTLKISSCTNMTLTLGWITLFKEDMGEGAPHREDKVTIKQKIKIWLWAPLGAQHQDELADRRSQCNLKLNLRHCTANYTPILSSERAPYIKNKKSNCHSNKCNIWSLAPKGARRTDRLTVGRNVTLTSTDLCSTCHL
jgi:hypothetical protein